ncbi:MAG: adenylate/guanylate cyclase domain-containing protein, partial [Candidatus Eiseniibacteriota bacterium]
MTTPTVRRDSDVSARRDLNWLLLRFADPAVEASYRQSSAASDLRYARTVLLFVLALTIAVAPVDFWVFAADRWPDMLADHAAELVVILGLFGLSFVPRLRGRHMILMSVLALFFVTVYGVFDAEVAAPGIYVAGGALVIVAIYVLLPFDFVWGVATGVAASALYLAIVGLALHESALSFLILSFFMAVANAIGAVSLYHRERLRRVEFANLREIDAQRSRYRDLLTRILPQSVADRLQRGEHVADRFDQSTVLFADLVGFTPAAARHAPEDVVAFLDSVFSTFDGLVDKHGVEKIKTIGDAYMVAGGLPSRHQDHAVRIADLALDMLGALSALRPLDGVPVQIRIGISTGPVVAGVIGERRFGYDLWGDTVNVASRMEAYGAPGHIQVS